MQLPNTFLSRPTVILPESAVDNEQIVASVRSQYRGQADGWPEIETTMRTVFARCNSAVRYIEPDPGVRVGAFAALAGSRRLEEQGLQPADLAKLIYCGVAREDFEPATAMEVAARMGVTTVHAFDVTSACVGQLEGIQIARAFLSMDANSGLSLVVSGELTRGFLSHDIQSRDDLLSKAAGLTIGNAAAAWLVGSQPFAGGCLQLLAARTFSRPQHWELCRAPIDGTFSSLSHDLFKLHHYVPGQLRDFVATLGWDVTTVDHFVLHQPSDAIVQRVVEDMGVDPARAVRIHSLFGNTVSTSVALAMDHTLRSREVRAGDRFVLASAAAGFSLSMVAGIWRA